MKHVLFLGIIVCTVVMTGRAQNTAASADTAHIRLLEEKIAALERRVALIDKANASSASVGGQVFSYFSYTANNGIEGRDVNRFDFERLYLTVKGAAFNNVKYQMTTDIFRNAAAGSYYSGLSVRLKFAYLDYAPTPSVSIKAGMIAGPWTGFIDGYWKYRGISPSFVDRNGYYASADLGLSAQYQLPSGFGDVSAFILNGSGYAAPEANRFKDVAARITLSPFQGIPVAKNLTLAGYGYKGANQSVTGRALQRDRAGVLAGYADAYVSAYAEADRRWDAPSHPDTVVTGNGLSFFGEIKAPFESIRNTVALVLRYDIAEPNISKGGDMTRFAIVGLSYRISEKCQFVLDRQVQQAETATLKRADNTKTDRDERWMLHALLTF